MKVIVVRNYGKRIKYNTEPTFTIEDLDDIRIVERNKLRRQYEEMKKRNWATDYDKREYMGWLSRRLVVLEKDSATLEEINRALYDMCCVSIPMGIDPIEYIKMIRVIYYTGYDRGYSDGGQ